MANRIACIVVGMILGYLVLGTSMFLLVSAVLIFAVGLSETQVISFTLVDLVILSGCTIAGGVGGNKFYDRYWDAFYKLTNLRRSREEQEEFDDSQRPPSLF